MSLTLPGEVAWVLDLLGYEWPEANEDDIHAAAEAWRTFANEIAQLENRGLTTAQQVLSANSGDAVDAFSASWRRFSDGGDGYLSDARETAEVIAFALDAVAIEVVVSKLMVIAQLVALAFEIISAQAAAPFTFGLSEAGALGATQITRLAVREILNKLKQAIVEKVTQIIEKASVKAIKELAVDFLKHKAKDLIVDTVQEKAKEKAKELVVDTAKDAFKQGVTTAAQDVVRQGVNVHYGAQDGYDLRGAVGKGVDKSEEVVQDKVKETKEQVTGLPGKATDPNTYIDAATEKGKEALGDKIQPHIDRIAGQNAAEATDGGSGEGGDGGTSGEGGDGTSGENNDGSGSTPRRTVRSVFG
jgi:hypothetical protein